MSDTYTVPCLIHTQYHVWYIQSTMSDTYTVPCLIHTQYHVWYIHSTMSDTYTVPCLIHTQLPQLTDIEKTALSWYALQSWCLSFILSCTWTNLQKTLLSCSYYQTCLTKCKYFVGKYEIFWSWSNYGVKYLGIIIRVQDGNRTHR